VRQFAGYMLMMVASLFAGLLSAVWMMNHDGVLGSLRSGPWRVALQAATDPDPYMRARLARDGSVALAVSEGLKLTATTDDDGKVLRADCQYRIVGNATPSRYWSFHLAYFSEEPAEIPFHRTGFTSSEVVRDAEGNWVIELGKEVRAGQVLPLANQAPFILVLHLYEPSILGGAAAISREQLPHIHVETCR